MERRQIIAALRVELYRMTGREYRIHYDSLDLESLRELLRFVRDADAEARNRAKRAQLNPWREA